MVKEIKHRNKNKNVVGNDSAPRDASIEEIELDNMTAAGLGEVAEAGNGSAWGWHQTGRKQWRVQVVGAMCPSR